MRTFNINMILALIGLAISATSCTKTAEMTCYDCYEDCIECNDGNSYCGETLVALLDAYRSIDPTIDTYEEVAVALWGTCTYMQDNLYASFCDDGTIDIDKLSFDNDPVNMDDCSSRIVEIEAE